MMNNIFELPTVENEREWIEYLPNYQKKLVNQLLESNPVEEIGSLWVDSTMDTNSPFSTNNNKNQYFNAVLKEIKKFICGDERYEEERKSATEAGKGTIITLVANAVSNVLGLPAELIAPAVATTFVVISKVGTSAWCEINTIE